MITGSHNAAEYNGFKMCVGKEALYGDDIQQLRKIYEKAAGLHPERELSQRD